MKQVTFTHADGHITVENILTEIDSVITDDERYEYIVWDNGSVSIDAITDEGPGGDHVQLDLAAICQLRSFLLSRKIAETLASA